MAQRDRRHNDEAKGLTRQGKPLPDAGDGITLVGPDGTYPTVVEAVENGILRVLCPMVGREYVEFPPGQRVTVHYADVRGFCRLTGVVAGMEEIEGVQTGDRVLVIAFAEEPECIERRRYVRIPVLIPVEFSICARGGEQVLARYSGARAGTPGAMSPDEMSFPGYARDLSLGGMTLSTEVELCTGLYLRIRLPAEANGSGAKAGSMRGNTTFGRRTAVGRGRDGRGGGELPGSLKGRVVRALGNGRYGIEFVEISEKEKACIMAFIIEQQALMKKYGLVP